MTSYNVIIHASQAEFDKFFKHDELVSVRLYERSPYILQDGRHIFRCTLRHPDIDEQMDYCVFESVKQLKDCINKHRRTEQ